MGCWRFANLAPVHAPTLAGAFHCGYIERLKAQAAQSVSNGKLEDEVARLKRANQELRTKNRTLTKWAEAEIAKVKKRSTMPRSTFNVIVNCLYPDKAPTKQQGEGRGVRAAYAVEEGRGGAQMTLDAMRAHIDRLIANLRVTRFHFADDLDIRWIDDREGPSPTPIRWKSICRTFGHRSIMRRACMSLATSTAAIRAAPAARPASAGHGDTRESMPWCGPRKWKRTQGASMWRP